MTNSLLSSAGWGSPVALGIFLAGLGIFLVCLAAFIFLLTSAKSE